MSRYIDADLLKAEFTGNFTKAYATPLIKAIIDQQPAADVQEVKHGKWTIHHEGTYKRAKCYCSVCGKSNGIGGIISNQKKPYCPNCGAKMESVKGLEED